MDHLIHCDIGRPLYSIFDTHHRLSFWEMRSRSEFTMDRETKNGEKLNLETKDKGYAVIIIAIDLIKLTRLIMRLDGTS